MYALRTSNDSKVFTECSSQSKIKRFTSGVAYDPTSFLDNELTWGVVLELSQFVEDEQSSKVSIAYPDFFSIPCTSWHPQVNTATVLGPCQNAVLGLTVHSNGWVSDCQVRGDDGVRRM